MTSAGVRIVSNLIPNTREFNTFNLKNTRKNRSLDGGGVYELYTLNMDIYYTNL